MSAEVESDAALVRAAATGDGSAFGQLVRRHQGVVRGMLRRLLGDPALADDLAQAAFLRAWQKRHLFSAGNFRGWLCTLAYHVGIAHLRKAGAVLVDEQLLSESAELTHDLSTTMDLSRAIDALCSVQKQAIVLSFQAGLSHSEIAAATGWPLGTVKSHIARAKARLQNFLEGYDHE